MSDSQSSSISRQTILNLARLAHLELTSEEVASYQRELGAILEFVNQLERADTSGCQPLHQVGGLTNRWRADRDDPLPPEQQPPPADLLASLADRLVDGQFRVPRPLTDSQSGTKEPDNEAAAN